MKRTEITATRKKAGLSKSALARLMGRSYRTILRWEQDGPVGISRGDEIVLEMLAAGDLPARYLNQGEPA